MLYRIVRSLAAISSSGKSLLILFPTVSSFIVLLLNVVYGVHVLCYKNRIASCMHVFEQTKEFLGVQRTLRIYRNELYDEWIFVG